jgi:hypothetical protein
VIVVPLKNSGAACADSIAEIEPNTSVDIVVPVPPEGNTSENELVSCVPEHPSD